MRPLGKGHIVLIRSMSADFRSGGSSIYAATKSGIQAFAEALRKEVNPEGIKVSLIEPGKTGSDMVERKAHRSKEISFTSTTCFAPRILPLPCTTSSLASTLSHRESADSTHLQLI